MQHHDLISCRTSASSEHDDVSLSCRDINLVMVVAKEIKRENVELWIPHEFSYKDA